MPSAPASRSSGRAVTSALPDIVPRSRIIQANSAFNIIYTGAGIIGNAGGGFLYQFLGAPLMFLLNGLSYIVSAVSLLFIRIPKIVRERVPPAFFAEMKQGLAFVWNIRGLRFLFGVALVLNFFATIGIVLLLPLFQRTAGLRTRTLRRHDGALHRRPAPRFPAWRHVARPAYMALRAVPGLRLRHLALLRGLPAGRQLGTSCSG